MLGPPGGKGHFGAPGINKREGWGLQASGAPNRKCVQQAGDRGQEKEAGGLREEQRVRLAGILDWVLVPQSADKNVFRGMIYQADAKTESGHRGTRQELNIRIQFVSWARQKFHVFWRLLGQMR